MIKIKMRSHDNGKANVCPDQESVAALAEGKLGEKEREALLEHIAVCESCSAE